MSSQGDLSAWQFMLQRAKEGANKRERLQLITNQVTDVLDHFKELILNSCVVSAKDMGNDQLLVPLGDMLSPLFGLEGHTVAYLQESKGNCHEEVLPHKVESSKDTNEPDGLTYKEGNAAIHDFEPSPNDDDHVVLVEKSPNFDKHTFDANGFEIDTDVELSGREEKADVVEVSDSTLPPSNAKESGGGMEFAMLKLSTKDSKQAPITPKDDNVKTGFESNTDLELSGTEEKSEEVLDGTLCPSNANESGGAIEFDMVTFATEDSKPASKPPKGDNVVETGFESDTDLELSGKEENAQVLEVSKNTLSPSNANESGGGMEFDMVTIKTEEFKPVSITPKDDDVKTGFESGTELELSGKEEGEEVSDSTLRSSNANESAGGMEFDMVTIKSEEFKPVSITPEDDDVTTGLESNTHLELSGKEEKAEAAEVAKSTLRSSNGNESLGEMEFALKKFSAKYVKAASIPPKDNNVKTGFQSDTDLELSFEKERAKVAKEHCRSLCSSNADVVEVEEEFVTEKISTQASKQDSIHLLKDKNVETGFESETEMKLSLRAEKANIPEEPDRTACLSNTNEEEMEEEFDSEKCLTQDSINLKAENDGTGFESDTDLEQSFREEKAKAVEEHCRSLCSSNAKEVEVEEDFVTEKNSTLDSKQDSIYLQTNKNVETGFESDTEMQLSCRANVAEEPDRTFCSSDTNGEEMEQEFANNKCLTQDSIHLKDKNDGTFVESDTGMELSHQGKKEELFEEMNNKICQSNVNENDIQEGLSNKAPSTSNSISLKDRNVKCGSESDSEMDNSLNEAKSDMVDKTLEEVPNKRRSTRKRKVRVMLQTEDELNSDWTKPSNVKTGLESDSEMDNSLNEAKAEMVDKNIGEVPNTRRSTRKRKVRAMLKTKDELNSERKKPKNEKTGCESDKEQDLPYKRDKAEIVEKDLEEKENNTRRSTRGSKVKVMLKTKEGLNCNRRQPKDGIPFCQYIPTYPVDEITFKEIWSRSIQPKCPRCQVTYSKKHNLVKHWRESKRCKANRVSGQSLSIFLAPKMYSCAHKDCQGSNVTWTQPITVHKHWNQVHGPESAPEHCICMQCGEKFVSTSLHNLHVSQKHPNNEQKRVTCQTCKEVLADEKALVRHMEKHSERLIPCKYCNKTFYGERTRKDHLYRSHRKELGLPEAKKNPCKVCGKAVRPNELENHMRSHTGKQPDPKFKCEHCGKQLAQRDSYQNHLMATHGIGHECDLCQKMYFTKHHLDLHYRNAHGDSH